MKSTHPLILLGLLLPSAALAQQPAAATFSLEQAIALARQNNPTYQQALNDPQSSQATERIAWSRFLPTPSVNMSSGGGPVRRSDADGTTNTRSSSSSISLGLDMTLIDDGSRMTQYRSARLATEGTRISLGQREIELRSQVTSQYFAVVLAERAVRLEEQNLEKRRESHQDTKDRFRTARSSQIDLIRAEEAVATAQNRVAGAMDAARKRRLTLFEVIGTPVDITARLDSTIPAAVDVKTLNGDSLVALALRESPAIQEGEINLDRQRLNARQSRLGRWRPNLSLSADYGLSGSSTDYDALYSPTYPENTLRMSLGLSYSLPNLITTSASVTQSELQLADQTYSLRRQQLAIERQVRSQLIDLLAAARDLALAEEQRARNREVVALAEEHHTGGRLGYFEYQQYIESGQNAERAVLDARLQVITAQLALEQTLGVPLRR
jgi:outer membrane protein TolC